MCICIGLDVHAKKTTGFAVPLDGYDEEGQDFCREFNREFKTFGADRAELERMAGWLKGTEHSILIENSTKTHEVFWILVDAGCTVVVANANDLYRITKSVKKTDHHDSEELAHYMRRRLLGENEFAQCLMVDPVWMNRRQLCRLYARTASDLSDLRRRIRSFMLLRGISVKRANEDITKEFNLRELEMNADCSLALLIEEARWLIPRLDAIRKALGSEFKGEPLFEIISSIPGFGVVTASYISSMVIDIGRFENPSQFAAYFGVVPKQRESADHAKRCGITRRGDDTARKMLVDGTFHHIIHDRDRLYPIPVMYDRLRSRGMPHKKALMACTNKMAQTMFVLLRNGEEFRIQ